MQTPSEFKASHNHARITARKARLSADMVRGLPINRALEILAFTPRRSARMVEKVLKSAIANANQADGVDLNRLYVSESRVDEGPLLGGAARWRPASRGRAMPIRKRTSHIHIGLSHMPETVLAEQPAGDDEDGS